MERVIMSGFMIGMLFAAFTVEDVLMKVIALVVGMFFLFWMARRLEAQQQGTLSTEVPLHGLICVCGSHGYVHEYQAGQLVMCSVCQALMIAPHKPDTRAWKAEFERSSERLNLQLASKRDWRAMLEIHGDARNYDYEISEPETAEVMKKKLHETRFPRGFLKSARLQYKVMEKESQKVIGILSVSYTLPYYAVHVGIMIHHDFTNQGYGREALRTMVAILFEQLGVHKIYMMCDSKNEACVAMIKALGFMQEGLSKDFFQHPKRGWLDSPYFALINPARHPEGV